MQGSQLLDLFNLSIRRFHNTSAEALGDFSISAIRTQLRQNRTKVLVTFCDNPGGQATHGRQSIKRR
ncbi:hypothetical protein SXCC_01412 [Gluconacetobacter sp. SXCC-1]|nr:hypothetical protein SXCC_01412 [Gluconacetobacter sp. SXCC-1]